MTSHSTSPRLILSPSSFHLLAYDHILFQVTLIKKTMELLHIFFFMTCHTQAPWFIYLKQISYLPYSRAVALEKDIITSFPDFLPKTFNWASLFIHLSLKSFIPHPWTPTLSPLGNKLSQMIKILYIHFFPLVTGHIFLLLCMLDNFWLNAKYCKLYNVECWIFFSGTINISGLCSGVQLGCLASVWCS